jgi:hypothetical protein
MVVGFGLGASISRSFQKLARRSNHGFFVTATSLRNRFFISSLIVLVRLVHHVRIAMSFFVDGESVSVFRNFDSPVSFVAPSLLHRFHEDGAAVRVAFMTFVV